MDWELVDGLFEGTETVLVWLGWMFGLASGGGVVLPVVFPFGQLMGLGPIAG